ncbi:MULTISPECIES: putative Ig domain-containing protein [Thermodesulfovibrio]|uniref:putative Ig domain-containing protein n=1 Tax=Thermodesulfovibrio TaxID=28261 RepID=UPI002635A9A0|nr:putative Ig domain-containing protein [Thermodesulfovibrio sp.]
MKRIFNNKGLTLVEVAIVLVILGLLIGLGASLIGPLTKRAKINETKETLNANVEAIISWAAGNKRLPNTNEFVNVIRNRNDSWGKPFYYIVDNNLVQQPTGTENKICDRRTTNITVRVYQDANNYQDIPNVAFLIISSGENYNNQTAGTQQITTATTIIIPYNDAPNIDYYTNDFNRPEPYDDIVKWVTLDELRIKVGCQGAQLKILNNELPYGYVGSSYNATIYAEGGISFSSGGRYQWCREGSLPSGLNANPSNSSSDCLNGGNWAQADSISITGTPTTQGTYSLKFYVRDNDGNTASKTLVLTINPQSSNQNGSPPGSQVSFVNNIGQFQSTGAVNVVGTSVLMGLSTNNTTGCFWYPSAYQLSGKTMRAFFKFKFLTIDTSSTSTQYADGFTFALATSDMPNNACGSLGEYIGFGGLGYDSIALEIDTYPNSARGDTSNNHVAVVKRGNNTHGASTTMGTNPSCQSEGCVAGSNATWLEDGVEHTARVEIITGCNSNCNDCGNNTQNYALFKAWIDCPASSCRDLNQNYTATPTVSHCFQLPTTMNSVKFGFTQGTGASVQQVEIKDFGIGFF